MSEQMAVNSAGDSIIGAMQRMSDDGWCVVLKRLPPELGWLIDGSRSEYDVPGEGASIIGVGTWCCEASDMRHADLYRHSGFIMHPDPLEAVTRLLAHCEAESTRARIKKLAKTSSQHP